MATDHVKKPTRAELESQIAATQASLSQKVSALASGIQNEVKGTLVRVADHVETSVTQVSGTLEQNIQRVSDRVHGTVDGVKSALDVPSRVQAEPLKMFGLATLVGGILGLMVGERKARREHRIQEPQAASPAGPAALIGLAATLLRPVLVAATREMVSRKLASGGNGAASAGLGGGSGYQSGPVYHS